MVLLLVSSLVATVSFKVIIFFKVEAYCVVIALPDVDAGRAAVAA